LATLVAVAAMLTPLAIAAIVVIGDVQHSSAGDTDVAIDVQQGWGPQQIGDELQHRGVITSSLEFQKIALSAKFILYPAGRYAFVTNSSAREALDTLRGGPERIIPDEKLLLPPGLTIGQIADRVGKLPGKSRDRFLEVAKSGTVRSRYEPAGVDSLEGLTWPDTYFVGANDTETDILRKIVNQFDAKADAIGLMNAGASNGGLDAYKTLTLASLIEAEAGSPADRPLISSVLVNRLHDGTPLQSDATLCYAKGGCPPVPTQADRKLNSPYNTYKVTGLPPTPIKTVSEAALRAALTPAPTTYRYFVSDKNGKTYYATTLAEHEKNVAKARSVG
jgi:UPF0755 protein